MIPGKGIHSGNGISVLHPVVLQTFAEEFNPSVARMIDEYNRGKVVVSESEISKWMSAKDSETNVKNIHWASV